MYLVHLQKVLGNLYNVLFCTECSDGSNVKLYFNVPILAHIFIAVPVSMLHL